MVQLFQRKLFQVLPNPPCETTSTFSSVTNAGHFISLRPFVNKAGHEDFPFEWCFGGISKYSQASQLDADTAQIIFTMELDTNTIRKVENVDKDPVTTKWATWPSGDVEETGEVFPFGKDKEGVKFRELWQPINPDTYETEQKFNILPRSADASKFASIALYVNNSEFHGLVTIVGNFVQGFLHKKGTESMSFIRAAFNGSKYEYSIKFGPNVDVFPTKFHNGVKVGEKVGVFEVIEA
ncbi:hypothetical protein ACO0RG_003147 [Hanseniaspora osmophila]|uniref:Protein HRI1 n=1 Tax=Hanseniaspora osmophila TaxID=56408 RepID=A0A1E5RDJ8_9ASCO|nr:Protein HRI1 [Hanseniaspora osmophila]